jgi:hypothetical protein
MRRPSEVENLGQRKNARVVLPRVGFAFRTTVEDDLAARNAHADRYEHRLRTSCANQHSVPPNTAPVFVVDTGARQLKDSGGDMRHTRALREDQNAG